MISNGKFYTYKKEDGNGYSRELEKCIEETCQYCIENTCADPSSKINNPIMMLGKIQSGKTRAFTGLISLAFDNDFDIIFILTKCSKALAQQTITRMKQEFSPFVTNREIVVSDIMKTDTNMGGYQLQRKHIIVAKKQAKNLDNILNFVQTNNINSSKRCLIIDDEADTTGIGYEKGSSNQELTLRTVSSKVNEVRGSLDGCVFVQVTATPYALYLQPEYSSTDEIYPIKPQKTTLVPHGDEYIGGEYYFIKSQDDSHPASLIFCPMGIEEAALVANQKRKGKKSKIEDRRSFKIENILTQEDSLPIYKYGLINFFIGVIALRLIHNEDVCYSYVIHTATQKTSHINLQEIAQTFISEIAKRDKTTELMVNAILTKSYHDIENSIKAYNLVMPPFEQIKEHFYRYIDGRYYSIDTVNADKDIEMLLDADSGELNLRTPCSIFVGGQVLDRGVTIPNMVGFYYARNPSTTQQDTVLQHSRMFGYRKKMLPITRLYTTNDIYQRMMQITEIDQALRDEIAKGSQGHGIYFITQQTTKNAANFGKIIPCSLDKVRASKILLFEPHRRTLPVGFTPHPQNITLKATKTINNILLTQNDFVGEKNIDEVIQIVNAAYTSLSPDEDSARFISEEQFIISLKYLLQEHDTIYVIVKRNKKNRKFRKSGRLEDAPDNGEQERAEAIRLAETRPVLILLYEDGRDSSWDNRPFWWPILVAPQNAPKTIYAETLPEKIVTPKSCV